MVCDLNKKKLQFNKSLIFSDTTIIGEVSCFWSTDINDLEFRNSTKIKFWHPLMLEIKKIAPDFIFTIFNLPNSYWYVKNNQLNVLMYEHTYEHSVPVLKNFVTVKADDYIKHYIEGTELIFLSHKTVVY